MKKALILGISGQDGFYLSGFLSEKGYEVHGISRGDLPEDIPAINHKGYILDDIFLKSTLNEVVPDEIYHLAGQKQSSEFEEDIKSIPLNVDATVNILSFLKIHPNSRFFFAGSSEMFGNKNKPPLNETTPFDPISPYAVSKVAAYYLIKIHREKFKTFACAGILFNHESPKRGENFVTKKIALGLEKILRGGTDILHLGNLDAKRDWGYAKEYVEAMWLMLQQEEPNDYVLATNEMHTIREFVEEACKMIGKEITWIGSGLDERGIDKASGRTLVAIDPTYFRPAEFNSSRGDYSKAKKELGWEPKTGFKDLVKIMINSDYENKI